MTYKMFNSEMRYTDTWKNFRVVGSIEESIQHYCENKFSVYDSDNGFEDEYYFVIQDTENELEHFFKVVHVVDLYFEPEWNIENTFYINKIEKASFEYPKKNRDWIKV